MKITYKYIIKKTVTTVIIFFWGTIFILGIYNNTKQYFSTQEQKQKPMKTLLQSVQELLKQESFNFEKIEGESALILRLSGENCEWNTIIETQEEWHFVTVYSLFPQQVPFEKRLKVNNLLTRINSHNNTGCFSMDLDSGIIVFKTSMTVVDDSLSDSYFWDVFFSNFSIMETYFHDIENVIGERKSEAERRIAKVVGLERIKYQNFN